MRLSSKLAMVNCLLLRVAFAAVSVQSTPTQATLSYTAPSAAACSLKAADMNRRIIVTAGAASAGTVTLTTRSPHGLLAGAVIYLEASGVSAWNGWQTVTAVADTTHLAFSNATGGTATAGSVGVLVDDLNSTLFTGADLDSRTGNLANGTWRAFVVGKRTAERAADGNRYTRALQAFSRHVYTLTCGATVTDGEFTTPNIALGDTRNSGMPADRAIPGEYAYPTVQWSNKAQSLIDPLTGVRSVRMTAPSGTASAAQSFQSAVDLANAWGTPTGPLTTGSATCTGPCGTDKKLLLRADNLSLYGGAPWTAGSGLGASLDWVQVAITGASVSDGSCVGDDCKISLCLTTNGVSCTSATKDVTLTGSAASYTVGTQGLLDVWQTSGAPTIARPDVSKATGTANYVASTGVLTRASGDKFSVAWGPGSRIVVGGTEYPIASVQSELKLTLASGPAGDLTGSAFTGNNFGVLVWKKSAKADTVTLGPTTFLYGSSSTPSWSAASGYVCSTPVDDVNGLPGFHCFVGNNLYWISEDGSEMRDLGYIRTTAHPDNIIHNNTGCGSSSASKQFDPLDANTWYCSSDLSWSPGNYNGIVKATYHGDHTTNATPTVKLPDCTQNGGVEPCVAFVAMTDPSNKPINAGAFNPAYSADYGPVYAYFAGVSPQGHLAMYIRGGAQNMIGWVLIYDLGDRTPVGTSASRMRVIAATSTYRQAPYSWCAIHGAGITDDGYAYVSANDMSAQTGLNYYMTLDSMTLTASVGGSGGLVTCPSNPLGATGVNCTEITVTSEPMKVADNSYLQDLRVGDMVRIGTSATVYEYMRVVTKTDHTHFTVQRGYRHGVQAWAGSTLYLGCGMVCPLQENMSGMWNYLTDPYGLNADWTTIFTDLNEAGGHAAGAGLTHISTVGYPYRIGAVNCPIGIVGTLGLCYQVRVGTTPETANKIGFGVASAPPFAGAIGFGLPNAVDGHPGPCMVDGTFCFDARPANGGETDGNAANLGTSAAPWANVETPSQLWKFTNGATALKRKHLNAMAYVGRKVLVDVSGPGSVLATTSAGAYQYCVALADGECRPTSTTGDVFVNAPYVAYAYCRYPGIAIAPDDDHSICVGPLGAYTGNMLQVGTVSQDSYGARNRRLGTVFSRWNQQYVFWNISGDPLGTLAFSQVRSLDGVREEDMVTFVPPYPAPSSLNRGTFQQVNVSVPPGGNNAVVEFGYDQDFFCTSRQEVCAANAASITPATPFYWASETFTGLACSTGCTIAVPALSQRTMYYRWKQRDVNGATTATGATQVISTP